MKTALKTLIFNSTNADNGISNHLLCHFVVCCTETQHVCGTFSLLVIKTTRNEFIWKIMFWRPFDIFALKACTDKQLPQEHC